MVQAGVVVQQQPQQLNNAAVQPVRVRLPKPLPPKNKMA